MGRPSADQIKPKRKEKDVVKACLDYLQTLENVGKIHHYDRLNSGTIYYIDNEKRRRISLCRAGTADIFIREKNGRTIWIECKRSTKENITEKQRLFAYRMKKIGDAYFIVSSVEALRLILNTIKMK